MQTYSTVGQTNEKHERKLRSGALQKQSASFHATLLGCVFPTRSQCPQLYARNVSSPWCARSRYQVFVCVDVDFCWCCFVLVWREACVRYG